MAFNFGAFVGGLSESVAEGIETNEKRVNLLVDKAWDTHTQRYWKKRDKEEGKAELVESAIKKLSQLTNGNVDHAAALYNKIGNVDDATMFATNGMQLKNLGQDLTGYIGSMPENFEGSNFTVEDYSKSFMKPIKFETDLGAGAQDGVSEGLATRAKQMEGLGIPSTLDPTKVSFAEITDVNISGLAMPKNKEAAKNVLYNKAITSKANGDTEGYDSAIAGLTAYEEIDQAAQGGDADLTQQKDYRVEVQNYIKNQQSINRDDLRAKGITAYNSASPNTDTILDPKAYENFRKEKYNLFKQQYVKTLKGRKLENFKIGFKQATGYEAIKDALNKKNNNEQINKESAINSVDIPKVKRNVPNDIIIKDIQTSGKQTVIDSLVNSANYTLEEATAKVESLAGSTGYGTYGISGTGMNLPKDK
tara:strand:- start:221 stop:1480 length:1260 start_codon:yes stop_codon:yes gene_type:complete